MNKHGKWHGAAAKTRAPKWKYYLVGERGDLIFVNLPSEIPNSEEKCLTHFITPFQLDSYWRVARRTRFAIQFGKSFERLNWFKYICEN